MTEGWQGSVHLIHLPHCVQVYNFLYQVHALSAWNPTTYFLHAESVIFHNMVERVCLCWCLAFRSPLMLNGHDVRPKSSYDYIMLPCSLLNVQILLSNTHHFGNVCCIIDFKLPGCCFLCHFGKMVWQSSDPRQVKMHQLDIANIL